MKTFWGRCAGRKRAANDCKAVPPRAHYRYGSGGWAAEALRPRRGGGRVAVSSSADPWTGRRRLWPKANRRRRGGQGGAAPCGFFPLFLGRPRNRAARRGGTRQTTPLAERQIQARRRSATDRPSASGAEYLKRPSAGQRQTAPLNERKTQIKRSRPSGRLLFIPIHSVRHTV